MTMMFRMSKYLHNSLESLLTLPIHIFEYQYRMLEKELTS